MKGLVSKKVKKPSFTKGRGVKQTVNGLQKDRNIDYSKIDESPCYFHIIVNSNFNPSSDEEYKQVVHELRKFVINFKDSTNYIENPNARVLESSWHIERGGKYHYVHLDAIVKFSHFTYLIYPELYKMLAKHVKIPPRKGYINARYFKDVKAVMERYSRKEGHPLTF